MLNLSNAWQPDTVSYIIYRNTSSVKKYANFSKLVNLTRKRNHFKIAHALQNINGVVAILSHPYIQPNLTLSRTHPRVLKHTIPISMHLNTYFSQEQSWLRTVHLWGQVSVSAAFARVWHLTRSRPLADAAGAKPRDPHIPLIHLRSSQRSRQTCLSCPHRASHGSWNKTENFDLSYLSYYWWPTTFDRHAPFWFGWLSPSNHKTKLLVLLHPHKSYRPPQLMLLRPASITILSTNKKTTTMQFLSLHQKDMFMFIS